jgi:hypothetical protein
VLAHLAAGRSTRDVVAADSFASLLTHPVTSAAELDHDFWVESFLYDNRLAIAWHTLLDPDKFDAHVAQSAGLQPSVIACAHGPVLVGRYIEKGFEMNRQLPRLDLVDQPGQLALDQMIAAIAAAPTPQAAGRRCGRFYRYVVAVATFGADWGIPL